MAEEKQVIHRDSNQAIDIVLIKFLKQDRLPSEILKTIKLFDEQHSWQIAVIVYQIRQLPSDILKIIKSYSRISAFGIQYAVINELQEYHKNVQMWLSINKRKYKMCRHCAGYVMNLEPYMNLVCPCQAYRNRFGS